MFCLLGLFVPARLGSARLGSARRALSSPFVRRRARRLGASQLIWRQRKQTGRAARTAANEDERRKGRADSPRRPRTWAAWIAPRFPLLRPRQDSIFWTVSAASSFALAAANLLVWPGFACAPIVADAHDRLEEPRFEWPKIGAAELRAHVPRLLDEPRANQCKCCRCRRRR